MFKRLAVVLMLVLLHLQWGLAQAHDSAEEIQGIVMAAAADAAPAAQADNPAHSQEPGGICQFHDLAHSVALAAFGEGLFVRTPADSGAWQGDHGGPPATGRPPQIDRPRWPRHAFAVVAL